MTSLVVGASGATGKLLVEQLLTAGQKVNVIIRPSSKLPLHWDSNPSISIIRANIADMSVEEMAKHLSDCDAVASCLGHNLTFKGIFGKPHKLVSNSVKLLCNAIQHNQPKQAIRFVLMNTTANRNRDLSEPVSFCQKVIMSVVRLLVPPHPDNEKAADYLRINIGQTNRFIEWVAVRPDALIDEDNVSDYKLYASPTRSALFNPGKTSRINVGNLTARLIVDDVLWHQWKGQMPVIYNCETNN